MAISAHIADFRPTIIPGLIDVPLVRQGQQASRHSGFPGRKHSSQHRLHVPPKHRRQQSVCQQVTLPAIPSAHCWVMASKLCKHPVQGIPSSGIGPVDTKTTVQFALCSFLTDRGSMLTCLKLWGGYIQHRCGWLVQLVGQARGVKQFRAARGVCCHLEGKGALPWPHFVIREATSVI